MTAGRTDEKVAGGAQRAISRGARERQLEHAERLASLGVWEWDGRADRLTWSEGLSRIFGLGPPARAVSMDALLERVHPEDRAGVRATVEGARRPGQTFEFEVRVVRPDGRTRVVHTCGEVVAGDDDRPIRLIGVCQDVTALREAQRRSAGYDEEHRARTRAEADSARLHALLLHAPSAIATSMGPAHVFTMANRAHRALAGGREVVGRPAAEALPALARAGLIRILDRVYATGEPHIGTETRVEPERPDDPEGRPRWYNFVFQPLRDAAGRVVGVVHHAADVTALVRARLEAQKAVQTREETLAIVSHDLRSPLSIVSMAADAIRQTGGEAWDEELGMIKRAVLRMNRLIRDLTDVARLEAGRLSLRRFPHDPAALATEVVELYRPQAARRSVELALRTAEALPPVEVDRDRVVQVLANLVDNAVKFTERGAVLVEVEPTGPDVRFSVADTGPGIDRDHLPHVFDRFWRPETGRPRAGAGLGLAIAKGIVDAHGGRIGVESAPGRGATFWFTLPAA